MKPKRTAGISLAAVLTPKDMCPLLEDNRFFTEFPTP